jgi:hypothetical protein
LGLCDWAKEKRFGVRLSEGRKRGSLGLGVSEWEKEKRFGGRLSEGEKERKFSVGGEGRRGRFWRVAERGVEREESGMRVSVARTGSLLGVFAARGVTETCRLVDEREKTILNSSVVI